MSNILTHPSSAENTCMNVCIIFQSHVLESSKPSHVGAAAVLEFWVGILTQQNLWYRDKTVLFLMDQICCAAFTHHQEECVQKLLYQQHKVFNLLYYHFALSVALAGLTGAGTEIGTAGGCQEHYEDKHYSKIRSLVMRDDEQFNPLSFSF